MRPTSILLAVLCGLPALYSFAAETTPAGQAEAATAAPALPEVLITPQSDRVQAPRLRPTNAVPAASVPVAADPAGIDFNNGCSLPDWDRVRVPKTKEALEIQLGKGFTVVRRGVFVIASDLDEKRFDYVVNGVFACCRELLEREYFSKTPARVVTVYIFANRDSYVRGLREHFGMEPISPYGHYGHTKRYIVVNYATGPGTLVHEMTHSLMAADFPRAPIWISEGLASLYEQCKVEDNRLLGEQNWRLPELRKALDKGGVTALDTLFSCDTKSFRMMKESLNYAQSRYFCYYLQEKGLLREIYTRFRDNAADDPYGIKTVESTLGKSMAEVEKDWREWLNTQRWENSVEHPDEADDRPEEVRNAGSESR